MKQRALPLVLLVTLSRATNAEPPKAPTASATPSASSAPAGAAFLHGADIPAEATPPPSPADWEERAHFLAARGEAGPCNLSTLREWVRVECKNVPGAGLVAGDPKGVEVHVTDPDARVHSGDDDDRPARPLVTTLIFPVRRSSALVFSFVQLGIEYESRSLLEGGTLSVVWRAGKADPVLAMYNIPQSPDLSQAEPDW